MYLFKHIAQFLIYMMGWKPLTNLDLLDKHNYVVCVFSHTSYYDFMMMVLYYYAYHNQLKNIKTLIRPDYFNYYILGYWLSQIGGIPSTFVEDKNGGAVLRIVNTMRKQSTAQLLISPKGSIMKREWRSGYYHIAQALQANLMALGMDYEKKEVVIGNLISYRLPEEFIKSLLYKDLSKIVPLYTEREMMPIRHHNNTKVSVMSFDLIWCYMIVTTYVSCFSLFIKLMLF